MTSKELVIDASVVAKFFFDEPGGNAAKEILKHVSIFHAPLLLEFEFSNIVTKRVRRKIITPHAARIVRSGFYDLPLEASRFGFGARRGL